MKKRALIAFLALLAVGLAIAVYLRFHPREPTYQGRSLSLWLIDLHSSSGGDQTKQDQARKAVRAIGTNATPYLLNLLRAKDTWPQRIARWLADTYEVSIESVSAETRRRMAIEGFGALAEKAEVAIPPLRDLIRQDDADIAPATIHALFGIGSDKCLPPIIDALSSTNQETRVRAAATLWAFGYRAVEATPALLKALGDTDPTVRRVAASALGQIGFDPKGVVPALVSKLADSDVEVQSSAAKALGKFGLEAISALPELQTCLQSQEEQLRRAAAKAIVRVQCEMRERAIIRGPREQKEIALVFTGHEFAEAGETTLDELTKRSAKASFFLTGDFLGIAGFKSLIQRIADEGHYLGPHSDKHLLYCAWDNRERTLVTHAQFVADLTNNVQKVERFLVESLPFKKASEELSKRLAEGYVPPPGAVAPDPNWALKYFLPAYEYYNEEIATWTEALGGTLINFTPGTRSNADYTGEADKNFVSSQAIFDSILKREREDPHGLNGFILLLHLGSGPGRKDKFHYRFGELLDVLTAKGYQFARVDELLEPKPETDSPPDRGEAREGDRQ